MPFTISSIFAPLASCEITSDSAKTEQVEEIFTYFVDFESNSSSSEMSN